MSKPISITIPHEIGRAEARRRLDEGLAKLSEQALSGGLAKLHQAWDGDRMSFSAQALGQTITGRLEVLDEAVRMEVDLPNVFALIAGKIKGKLQTQGRLLLEKRKP